MRRIEDLKARIAYLDVLMRRQASRSIRDLRDEVRSVANKVEGLNLEAFFSEVELSDAKQKELTKAQKEALEQLHTILSVVDDFS